MLSVSVHLFLRRRPEGYTIVLYTYGAPRAGDEAFIAGASPDDQLGLRNLGAARGLLSGS
ncbi:hypothetical protein [Pseudomonas weihenstephanensis]|uniref:hypothetical protein n=1 Tax=Pseudomonas weihenstephanensis TaxID=1608994 RepID=UPI000B034584|nr:hypothetical protein [Pseudomonas weihenstephanensis]